jgi:3-oxoadipate enol-lactonase
MPYLTCDGANIFVDVAGEGPPLLFLHGFGMTHEQWLPQWSPCADGRQVFRIDLRAHGRSATTPLGYTYAAQASDVRRVMVQIGMDRHHPGFLVAHSMSADAALQAALDEPRSLRGVIVVTPAPWGHRWSEEWLSLWLSMRTAARAGRVAEAFERMRADHIFAEVRARPELLEQIRRMHAVCSGAHLFGGEREIGTPTLERLAGCKVPLQVLSAARDRDDFRTAARAIAARVPHADVHEFPDAGHFPNLETPADFTAKVLEFVRAHA